jgi:hypothetical protein
VEYQRDVPADAGEEVLTAVEAHVRAHLAAAADADDDPGTRAADVRVWRARHPEDPGLLRVEGYLPGEPVAPYLTPGHDPLAGVDPDLYAAEVAAAVRDEEVLRGQA